MPASPNPTNSSDDVAVVEIKHVFPDGHRSLFSNHFVIQQNNVGEFKLSFFEVVEPLLADDNPSERAKKLAEIGHVDAKCVATIVMTKPRVIQVLKAIADNITKAAFLLTESSEAKVDKS
jgi:hypothetical protein